jgi:uncharacterized BrkB/YihY/UPF0761 family membrane protein
MNQKGQNLFAYLLIAPLLILVLVLFVAPLLDGLINGLIDAMSIDANSTTGFTFLLIPGLFIIGTVIVVLYFLYKVAKGN